MATKVIYHANCPDGLGAALAARLALGNDVQLMPMNYSDSTPEIQQEDQVYVLDFSFSAEILDDWTAKGSRVVVIDHHKTAAHLKNRPGCIFDVSKSGAVLAWEYFHPSTKVPLLFQYLQDRDLWQWELPYTKQLSAGLAARPRTLEGLHQVHNEINERGIEALVVEGNAILRYQEEVIKAHVERARWQTIPGDSIRHTIPVVNATSLISAIGDALLTAYPDAPFVALWQEVDDKCLWSLRSTDDRWDVSLVAKEHGGGGHRNAAGFTTPSHRRQ